MTQQETQERNEQIAIMIGLQPLTKPYLGAYQTTSDTYNPSFYHDKMEGESWYVYLKYDSDWNWLMEAVDFIRFKNWSYDMYSPLTITDTVSEFECNFWRNMDPEIQGRSKISLKEAVFIAASDFAKLYNNKEL